MKFFEALDKDTNTWIAFFPGIEEYTWVYYHKKIEPITLRDIRCEYYSYYQELSQERTLSPGDSLILNDSEHLVKFVFPYLHQLEMKI